MSLTINAKTYSADAIGINAVGYVGAAHTVSVKDDFKLSRTAPKPTTTFSGIARSTAKLTRTLTLTGALSPTWDAICEFSLAVPVGAAGADVDSLLNDFGAYLSSADGKLWAKNQQINY